MRTRITSLALLVVVAGLGFVVYARVPGLHLRAASGGPVGGLYQTEEAWIVNETVRDIVEMAAYPAKATPPAVASATGDGLYRVSLAGGPVELDLRDDLWAPARFGVVARAALGVAPVASVPTTDVFSVVHPGLLEFVPQAIVEASDTTSRALSSNMRSARAHEAAALILGTFGLRESAGRVGDTRWALNRMTAHLALAGALADAPGIDGRLADAVLLVLTNRQVDALAALDRLERDDRTEPVAAWTRALRVRITQDWRTSRTQPSASRLEKEEYVRARRATVFGALASVELVRVGASPDAGWVRLVESSTMSVDDGWLATRALRFEQAEYREVFQRMHGKGPGADETDALNARATRCIGPDGPQVLPWGAWAEFAQRHLALFIDIHDRFYRKLQASAPAADAEKLEVTRSLGSLTMFPVATVFWTKGPRGAEADLTYLKDAVATLRRSPERITPAEWAFMETANHYEPVAGGVPMPAQWFIGASSRVPQNASARLKGSGHPAGADVYGAVLKVAPYDYTVANDYLTTKFGVKPPSAEIQAAFGARLEYDTRALSLAERVVPVAERPAFLRISCDVSPSRCLSLASALIAAKREPEAVVAYQRAFDDPSVDEVTLSNSSAWLVSYYLRNGKRDDALALAKRGAATGSRQGLVTFAYLAERLGRMDDAEAAYREAASHYHDASALLGFYYRAAVLRKETRYEAEWKAELGRMFPDGLTPVPIAAGRPAHGVAINSDSEVSRRAGLLIGDLIVGVEGYRVENRQQYRAVNAFVEQEEIKLTVWRGGALVPITVTAPGRDIGVELRSYPVEGYAE